MITVAILINGHPIVARNAVNQKCEDDKGRTKYLTDSGEIIWHDPSDGAVKLAHMLLDTIRNEGRNNE
jgi:hypothetical protein